jgi:uncharacterized membrane protein
MTDRLDGFAHVGRLLFAVALAGFGVLHFTAGDFLVGRAPAWPVDVPGQRLWAWSTGAALAAVAAAIVTGRQARIASLFAGALIAGWALLRNIPPTVASELLSPQWTQAGKSLVLAGGAIAVGGSLPPAPLGGTPSGRFLDTTTAFLRCGSISLGLFMVLCGIQHFKYDAFVSSLVPAWIPGAYFWTYATGLLLVAFGVGLLVPRLERTAAALAGAMIFSWVWLVHVPRIASHGEWLPPFEALALSGLALMLWRTLPPARRGGSIPEPAGERAPADGAVATGDGPPVSAGQAAERGTT